MYKQNQSMEQNENDLVVKQEWPEWLPNDWCIHQNIGDLGAPSNVFYSNPKGKRFYSKEDVFQYISSHPSYKINRQIKKAIKARSISEDKKLPIEDPSSSHPNSPPEWPEWLPQDWSIKRSCDDPCVMCYYSPKGKKFKCKDEVLNHIIAHSTKTKPKTEPKPKPKPTQIRRKRKTPDDRSTQQPTHDMDNEFDGTK